MSRENVSHVASYLLSVVNVFEDKRHALMNACLTAGVNYLVFALDDTAEQSEAKAITSHVSSSIVNSSA